MYWGYALVWPGSFLARDPDPLIARLKFLAHYGLQSTGVGLGELARRSEAGLERIGALVAEHGLALSLIPGLPWFDRDPDAVRRAADAALEQIERLRGLVRCPLVHTGVGGHYHRFLREPGLAWQMERLAQTLPALSQGCRDMGLPFGIENHGDYYVADLVELCRQVPHLGIFLDTGNTYLIGEAPLPAFELAAPYVVGTHFKDHRVRPCPDARPLHFEVGPSVIGEGDVPLRACYRLLRQRAPDPDRLVMQIELIPPDGMDPLEAFERSLAFVRGLEAEV